MEFTYKSQADIATMTDEEREDYALKKRKHEEALIEKKAKEEAEKLLKKSEAGLKGQIDKLSSEIKKQSQITKTDGKALSFKDIVSKSIKDNEEVVKNYSPTSAKTSLVLKDVTSDSFDEDSLRAGTVAVRGGVYQSPFSPIWLRNIFPSYSIDKGSFEYAQISGSEGAVSVWERGTGADGADENKENVDPTFVSKTANTKWIAGITRVERELLDDISYLQGTIANHLLYSRWGLFVAENAMIIDYIEDNAIAYSGDATIAVEKIIDAAYGQMLANYIQPTHVLMNNSDYVKYVRLNKADGSGEYDLPNNNFSVIDGRLFIDTLEAVPVPNLEEGTAYVVGSNESEFVSRLNPELEMFREDRDNVPKNMITFRVEERAGFYTKDVNSLIEVDLTQPEQNEG